MRAGRYPFEVLCEDPGQSGLVVRSNLAPWREFLRTRALAMGWGLEFKLV